MSTLVEADGRGVPMIVAVMAAPLVGVDLASDTRPRVLHAVSADQIMRSWGGSHTGSVCGVPLLKLLKTAEDDESGPILYEWPPSTRHMPSGYARCATCWNLTGRKKPRMRWMPASETSATAAWCCEECGEPWAPLPDRPGQCRRCGNRTRLPCPTKTSPNAARPGVGGTEGDTRG